MTGAMLHITKCNRCRCMHITTEQFALGCVLASGNWGSWRRWVRWSGGGISLSPSQAAVLFRLTLARGALVSTDELIDWLHGDREDGGPDDAYRTLAVHLTHLRKALKGAGFPGHFRTTYTLGIELIMLPRPAEQREVAA